MSSCPHQTETMKAAGGKGGGAWRRRWRRNSHNDGDGERRGQQQGRSGRDAGASSREVEVLPTPGRGGGVTVRDERHDASWTPGLPKPALWPGGVEAPLPREEAMRTTVLEALIRTEARRSGAGAGVSGAAGVEQEQGGGAKRKVSGGSGFTQRKSSEGKDIASRKSSEGSASNEASLDDDDDDVNSETEVGVLLGRTDSDVSLGDGGYFDENNPESE